MKKIILVHGAWMNASVWNKTIPFLEGKGYEIVNVNLPGHGDDNTPYDKIDFNSYVDAVTKHINAEDEVILAGHSMAGMVITQAGELKSDNIKKLIYIAAYLPDNGESLYVLSQKDKESSIGKFWRQDDPEHYSPPYITAEGIKECFAEDASQEDVELLIKTHKPESLMPFTEPVNISEEKYGKIKKTYLHTLKDRAVSYSLQKMMTARKRIDELYELDTCHSPFLTFPEQTAEIILK